MQIISKFFANIVTAAKAIRYDSLYYDTIDLACILNHYDLGARRLAQTIECIWAYEQERIHPKWRGRKKDFFLSFYYHLDYLYHKTEIHQEIMDVQKDAEAVGNHVQESDFVDDYSGLDLYFKELRLKLLYLGTQNYVRIKFRTLLTQYGYRRRTRQLIAYMNRSLSFYQIQPYVKNGQKVSLNHIPIDRYVIFRIKTR